MRAKQSLESKQSLETEALKSLCRLFLRHFIHVKKISPHTLRAYTSDLGEVFSLGKNWGKNWEKSEGRSEALRQKNPAACVKNKKKLEALIRKRSEKASLKWRKLAASSKSRKLAAIRSFARWLGENDYIEEDFRHLFKSPKKSAKIPHFLSIDEISALIETMKAKNEGEPASKSRALFFLLYGGGLRVSEACHLKTSAIDWKAHVLRITGKGGKERLAALPRQAFQHLEPLRGNSPYLFGAKPLHERKAYDMIRSLGNRANLLKPLHPHALRHSFATHLLSRGSDLRVLQELLGHKTLAATQKYTHLDLAQLSQTIESRHPLYQREHRGRNSQEKKNQEKKSQEKKQSGACDL